VARADLGTRGVCYCRDCQAFARFLGPPDGMLDAMGGTEIVAVRPRFVTLTQGRDHLACVSLSPKGTLRWYTRCCKTPIGNTPRDFRVSHVGLIHTCLEGHGPSVEFSFGPVRLRVNTKSAKGKPPPNSMTTFAFEATRYMASVAWTRLSGTYRMNPFFSAETGQPLVQAHVVSAHMRARLRGDA
jgi:hypothetical protein